MATLAQQIVDPVCGRTLREQRDMAEFIGKHEWIGRDMSCYTLRDGSQLMTRYNEDLAPVEIVVL